MACQQCGSGNFALLPLIWEQGTHVGGAVGMRQSVEAARIGPPQRVPVARRIVFLVVAALVAGPVLSNAIGRGTAVVIMVVLALAVGITVLRDLRWNRVEFPHAHAVWSRTFACRACGHRWLNGQVAAPPAENPQRRMIAIAAMCLLMAGPGLLTRPVPELVPAQLPPPALETVYLHGDMNVRSGPSTSFPTIATVATGTELTVGPADANGWAAIHAPDGRRAGYLYRRSDLIQTFRPIR